MLGIAGIYDSGSYFTMGTGTYGGGSQRGQEGSEQESVQVDDEGTKTAGDRGLAPPGPPS